MIDSTKIILVSFFEHHSSAKSLWAEEDNSLLLDFLNSPASDEQRVMIKWKISCFIYDFPNKKEQT